MVAQRTERPGLGLSVREVMQETTLSRFMVNRLIREKRLVVVQAGRRLVIPRWSLEKFLLGR